MNAAERWRTTFEEQGFLVVEDVVSPGLLSRLRNCLNGISRGHAKLESGLKERVYFTKPNAPVAEGSSPAPQLRVISDAAIFGWPFKELICYPPLLEMVEVLFGSSEFAFRYASCRVRRAGEKAGEFHREATPYRQTDPRGIVCIVPLEEMSAENGGTRFVRRSHLLSDEAALSCSVAYKSLSKWPATEFVTPSAPAGSALFFDYKVIHSTGEMSASSPPRRTVLLVWEPEGTLSTRPARFAYDGLRPRSRLPEHQKQMRMTFPHLFAPRILPKRVIRPDGSSFRGR